MSDTAQITAVAAAAAKRGLKIVGYHPSGDRLAFDFAPIKEKRPKPDPVEQPRKVARGVAEAKSKQGDLF